MYVRLTRYIFDLSKTKITKVMQMFVTLNYKFYKCNTLLWRYTTSFCYFFLCSWRSVILVLSFSLDLFPVDTGRKLNAHKTFRRRPGVLQNVLRTFNLRPVSSGMMIWTYHKYKLIDCVTPFSSSVDKKTYLGPLRHLKSSSFLHNSLFRNTFQ